MIVEIKEDKGVWRKSTFTEARGVFTGQGLIAKDQTLDALGIWHLAMDFGIEDAISKGELRGLTIDGLKRIETETQAREYLSDLGNALMARGLIAWAGMPRQMLGTLTSKDMGEAVQRVAKRFNNGQADILKGALALGLGEGDVSKEVDALGKKIRFGTKLALNVGDKEVRINFRKS